MFNHSFDLYPPGGSTHIMRCLNDVLLSCASQLPWAAFSQIRELKHISLTVTKPSIPQAVLQTFKGQGVHLLLGHCLISCKYLSHIKQWLSNAWQALLRECVPSELGWYESHSCGFQADANPKHVGLCLFSIIFSLYCITYSTKHI